MGGGDVLRAVLLEKIPELAEAAPRLVEPLPVGDLLYGVFPAIKPLTMLRDSLRIAEWFRRQLAAESPVLKATEADLLMALALAEFSLAMPSEDVKKNRIAVFCAQVSRKEWRKGLPFVPVARKRLDGLKRVYPEVLHCSEWPPQPTGDAANGSSSAEAASESVEPTLSHEEFIDTRRKCEALLFPSKKGANPK